MMSCAIEQEDDIIIMSPRCHEKLEAWSKRGIRDEDNIKLLFGSPYEEIRAAVKLAFNRCLGPKPDFYK